MSRDISLDIFCPGLNFVAEWLHNYFIFTWNDMIHGHKTENPTSAQKFELSVDSIIRHHKWSAENDYVKKICSHCDIIDEPFWSALTLQIKIFF